MSLGDLIRHVDENREASTEKSFNFLRRNRSAALRAELIGEHMLKMTSAGAADRYNNVHRYYLDKEGGSMLFLREDLRLEKNIQDRKNKPFPKEFVTTEPTLVDGQVGLVVSLRQRYDWPHNNDAQLVVPTDKTYLGSAKTDEVLATASYTNPNPLVGPLGMMAITPEFVTAIDDVYTEHLFANKLPAVGSL